MLSAGAFAIIKTNGKGRSHAFSGGYRVFVFRGDFAAGSAAGGILDLLGGRASGGGWGCVLLLPQLRARRRLRAYLLLILFAASAGLLYGRGWSAIISDPVQEKCGENHLFSATVCDWPERTDSGGWRVTVRLTEARGAKAVCYAKDEEMGGLEPGQALLGSAYWQDASEISSKELTTFTSRGVFALLYCEEMPSVTQGQAGSLRYLPQRLEKAFREKIPQVWNDPTVADLLQAELLGDRSGISRKCPTSFPRRA